MPTASCPDDTSITKILIAEDDQTARKMLSGIVRKWGYEPITVADGLAAWEAIQEPNPPRLLLLDWMMPKIDGRELCRRIRDRKSSNPPYIILLTARDATEDIVSGLDSGANDYIVKPFQPAELGARLRVGYRLLTLQAELNETRERLIYQARHDPLTGSLNRRAIMEEIEREMARSRRGGLPLFAAICDLDHFKAINDTYGHQTGDAVLNEFVQRTTANLRTYDRVGRYGGEEFLLLAPVIGDQDPPDLFERLRRMVAEQTFNLDGAPVSLTVSMGIARLHAEDSIDEFLGRADTALYEAKRTGRNRIVYNE